ncbi:MAG: AAA family ATPase [Acidobacteriota bacterium]|nr:AAA family ATPase [Acidobacteriota bacterium]
MTTPDHTELLSPETLERAAASARLVLEELDRILLGRQELHRLVLTAVLSRGHLLLEGMPGLGKTALVKALGDVLELGFNRVQFTPDLMPSDILGAHILEEKAGGGREMVFRPGPVFTNVMLADEINRASPKTQSALLEAMQERCVTLLGTTRDLPRPFFVMASQNPVDLEGTYPLPEAQLDRFLFKLHVGDLDVETMTQIIATRHRGEPPKVERHLNKAELEDLFQVMDGIHLPRPVAHYISRLVRATHPKGEEASERIGDYVAFGASPRAAIAIAEAARAAALLRCSPTVGFDDVRAVAEHALNHRIIPTYKARVDGVTTIDLVRDLLDGMDETGLSLPEGVALAGE